MTPEQISIIQTLAFILDKIGTWPVGMVLFVAVVGPWVFAAMLFLGQKKRDEKLQEAWQEKFEAVKKMYEDNVTLVKGYETLAGGMQDIITLNVQTMTRVLDAAKYNLFCPMVKDSTKPKGPTS